MRSPTLLLLAPLVLSACGGASDPKALTDSGYTSLSRGEHAAALEDFDAALAAIDSSDPLYLRVKMGSIEARSHSDPDRAQADFLALQKELPGKVDEADFSRVASRLGEADHLTQAIALLEEGKGLFPDSKVLDALGAKLAEQATKGDDPAAIEALRGLGYVGE